MKNIINYLRKEQTKEHNIPKIKVGDTVYIKSRYCKSNPKYNVFSGCCISKKNKLFNTKVLIRGQINKQFIEKEYPIHSHLIEQIKVYPNTKFKYHKAKLYYKRKTS